MFPQLFTLFTGEDTALFFDLFRQDDKACIVLVDYVVLSGIFAQLRA